MYYDEYGYELSQYDVEEMQRKQIVEEWGLDEDEDYLADLY